MTHHAPTTLVGLGRVVALFARRTDGSRCRITPQHERWLAWKADSRDLAVLVPSTGSATPARGAAAMRHRRFHGADPAQARPMTWPSPRGRRTTLGLLEAISYDASGIDSPSKGESRWIHQFGDRGERGHQQTRADAASPYGDDLLPQLDADAAGNLFIVRRRSNTYTVRDWIIA